MPGSGDHVLAHGRGRPLTDPVDKPPDGVAGRVAGDTVIKAGKFPEESEPLPRGESGTDEQLPVAGNPDFAVSGV